MSEGGKNLNWMYEGPSALVNREDYLLGRKVDKSLQLLEEAEQGNTNTWLSEAEKDLTPQSILNPSGPSGPVDVVRKIKDDPLYQIQKKEMEYRKQLLQNPILMKKLQQQHSAGGTDGEGQSSSKKKDKKSKKKKKKHKKNRGSSSDSSSSSDEEVDKIFNQLKKASDLSSLIKGSSTRQKEETPARRKRHDSRSESDGEGDNRSVRSHRRKDSPPPDWNRSRPPPREHHRRSRSRSPVTRRDNRDSERYRRHYSPNSSRHYDPGSRSERHDNHSSRIRKPEPPKPSSSTKPSSSKTFALDEEELERRRQEMMGNAKQRDEERERVVNKHREEIRKEQEAIEAQRKKEKEADFIRKQLSHAAESGSVEKRLKSNSYNIQRSKFAMDKNFARR